MERYTLKSVLGSFDYEVIEKDGKEHVATISKTFGNRYLKASEVPKPVLKFLKNAGYKINLLDVDVLNECLGIR